MTGRTATRGAMDAPLNGDLLIEASAGTGKTYALTTLVARLIVEEKRPINELLIVTFTIAAAGELRDRVWRTLQEARRTLVGTQAAAGPSDQACKLRKKWRAAGIPDTDAAGRLTGALRDFDRANVTTIHGFCQRALTEFALAAHIPFRFEVSGDDALEVAAATRDFWRREMAPADMRFIEYAGEKNFIPKKKTPWSEDPTSWVARCHTKPGEIRGAAQPERIRQALQSSRDPWVEAFQATREAWRDAEQRESFLEALSARRWNKNENDGRLKEIVAAFQANDPTLIPRKDGGYFGRASLARKLRKTKPPQQLPEISLYGCFERLGKAATEHEELWLAGQRRDLLEGVQATLHRKAWTDRRLGFNALLTELHRSLGREPGRRLAERIRARYPVALIDEFQDTDRLQADIFEKIYPGSDRSSGALFVVGDPKQSIYRFRGADVFAYIDAKVRLTRAHAELKLGKNYRSTPGLVEAVNAVFGRRDPFVIDKFGFDPTEVADHDCGDLIVHAEDACPFQIEAYRNPDGKKWTKGQLLPATAEHAASRIALLLGQAPGASGATPSPGGNGAVAEIVAEGRAKPLSEGHIAVLVRTGEQGKAVAEALRRRGIGSIEMGTDKVFDSVEADALYRLLYALCLAESEYNATPLLRGALAADLFGLNLQELARLRDDDNFWNGWRERARGPGGWAEVWKEQGIATLIRHILFARESDCASHLLRHPDGARRLTNYLHLADLLHGAETRYRPSRHGLLDWFRRSRSEPGEADETAQLRLESDESLVKIVTVHRAKGLQFPIVFCPFAWHGRSPKRPEVAEYFDVAAQTPVLDLRPQDDACDRQRLEEHADELRLFYVAVTRAKYRCVVGWAQARDSQHSPLAWLLHPDEGAGSRGGIEALNANAARVGKLDAETWLAELRRFAAETPDAVAVSEFELPLPDADAPPPRAESGSGKATFTARELGRPLKSIRQRTSYSALASDAGAARSEIEHQQADRPDHDPDDPDAPDEEAAAAPPRAEDEGDDELTVFTFPSGSRPGRCLHEIFEKCMQPGRDLDSICRDALDRHGIEPKWEEVARTLVRDTLDTPLAQPGETGSVFRIADLDRPIAELEFHLPVQGLRRAELAACLSTHGYDHSLPESGKAIEGFLHGYVDVVAEHHGRWYVMDYKSNHLGDGPTAYTPNALETAMHQHGYRLQYLLYLTALHRLLRLRLADYDYDRHVGGAFYLFVRGMTPTVPGSGAFHDRPSRACIEAIDACLGDFR